MTPNLNRQRVLRLIAAAPVLLAACATDASEDGRPSEEAGMDTRSVVLAYFDALRSGDGWQAWLGDDIAFTSYTSPVRQVAGKAAYLAATQRFCSSIRTTDLRHVLVDGDRACAQTHYELQPATSPSFSQ